MFYSEKFNNVMLIPYCDYRVRVFLSDETQSCSKILSGIHNIQCTTECINRGGIRGFEELNVLDTKFSDKEILCPIVRQWVGRRVTVSLSSDVGT